MNKEEKEDKDDDRRGTTGMKQAIGEKSLTRERTRLREIAMRMD
jgi:hypothetical protein